MFNFSQIRLISMHFQRWFSYLVQLSLLWWCTFSLTDFLPLFPLQRLLANHWTLFCEDNQETWIVNCLIYCSVKFVACFYRFHCLICSRFGIEILQMMMLLFLGIIIDCFPCGVRGRIVIFRLPIREVTILPPLHIKTFSELCNLPSSF